MEVKTNRRRPGRLPSTAVIFTRRARSIIFSYLPAFNGRAEQAIASAGAVKNDDREGGKEGGRTSRLSHPIAHELLYASRPAQIS